MKEGERLLEDCNSGGLCIDDVDADWGDWLKSNLGTTEFHGVVSHSSDSSGDYAMCYWTTKKLTEDGVHVDGKPMEPWCKKCHFRILAEKLKGGFIENH